MASRAFQNIFRGVLSGAAEHLRDRRLKREEAEARSKALREDEENYNIRRSRALIEDQQNYATNQARKIAEAERLKSMALQDATETELANKALAGGTMDAANMFMQNIPGMPTMSDIAMVDKNRAMATAEIKTDTEKARRDYWKNKAFKAATVEDGSPAIATPGKINPKQIKQQKADLKELLRMKQNEIKTLSDLINPATMSDEEMAVAKARLARAISEERLIKKNYVAMLEGRPSISSGNDFFRKVDDVLEKWISDSGPQLSMGSKALNISQNKALRIQPATINKAPTFLLAGGSMPAGPNMQQKKESFTGATELKNKALVKTNNPKNRALIKTDDKPFKFSALTNAIAQQLNRKLSEDELGYVASGIYDGRFDDLIFNFNEGTFTKAGAPSKRPLKDLIDSSIGDYAAENTFQFIPGARSSLANLLRGIILTDKGVNVLSQ